MSAGWMLLKKFVASPSTIGSVMPSSRFLVGTMMSGIDWSRTRRIAELGAGTGVITDAIDARRHPDSSFLCFERDPMMRLDLARRYPGADVQDDAFTLRGRLAEVGVTGLDCVVSGLPFANFTLPRQKRLLDDIHHCLAPGGVFIAFQYTRQIQPYLVSVYSDLDSQFVWANLPPAFVFICRKPVTPGQGSLD
jgi:phospholipid N-methyltransferase